MQAKTDKMSSRNKKRQLPKKIRIYQRKLYRAAKLNPDIKFDHLYEKIHQSYILKAAYYHSKEKHGSAGVDRQTFNAIEKSGKRQFIATLQKELEKQAYSPKAVKRVWKRKSKNKKRPLGIPTIKDRVAQTACKIVIEPIFEANFDSSSYGYRPNRSARGALKEIKTMLEQGKTVIYKADLSQYFDTIPHGKLLNEIKKRIKDTKVIRLIKAWLQAPVKEENGSYSGGQKHKKGTPQGGVISPLLSNIYLNILDQHINKHNGKYERSGVRMVRYADDFLLIGEKIEDRLLEDLHKQIGRMGLILNKDKSQLFNAKGTIFEFLGFSLRYERLPFGNKTLFWNIGPSAGAFSKVKKDIDKSLKNIPFRSPKEIAALLDPVVRNWLHYYRLGKTPECRIPFIPFFAFLEQRLFLFYQKRPNKKALVYDPGTSINYAQQAFKIMAANMNF